MGYYVLDLRPKGGEERKNGIARKQNDISLKQQIWKRLNTGKSQPSTSRTR